MDSDPDIEFIEKDSGMSSLGGSKDETPEKRPLIVCVIHLSFPRNFPSSANRCIHCRKT